MTVSVPRLLAALSSLCLVTVPVQAPDSLYAAVQIKKYSDIFTFSLFFPNELEEAGAALHIPELSEFQDIPQEQSMDSSHLSS